MAGLAEAIPETNVGFRLLKRMGYDPAAGGGAGAEPVGIEIRRSRAGLGAEPAVSVAPPQPSAEVAEGERRRVEEMAVELRARQSTQWRNRRVVWDYRKAEAALAQLENREAAPPPPEGEEKAEEEEEEVITEEVIVRCYFQFSPIFFICYSNSIILFLNYALLKHFKQTWRIL